MLTKYFELNNNVTLETIKTQFHELSFKFHPDVTKEDYDTTQVFQNILLEYEEVLRNRLYDKDNIVNVDVETEMKRGFNNIYVNVYFCIPRVRRDEDSNFLRYYELRHKKTIYVKDMNEAERMLKNMRDIKLHKDYLSPNRYKKCDREGFVYKIEYGPSILSDFFQQTKIVFNDFTFRVKVV